MPLHDDTIAFLEVRNAFRTALAAALSSETDNSAIQPSDPTDGDDACAVAGREEDSGCTNFAGLSIVPSIECQTDPAGWPNSDGLYSTLNDAISKSDDTNNSAAAQIRLMRQVNVMESYRKMLLHKKQRTAQFMTAWCECLKNEAQSQEEIEQLLLNQAIGQLTTSTEEEA